MAARSASTSPLPSLTQALPSFRAESRNLMPPISSPKRPPSFRAKSRNLKAPLSTPSSAAVISKSRNLLSYDYQQ
jgi:hypothetical protein